MASTEPLLGPPCEETFYHVLNIDVDSSAAGAPPPPRDVVPPPPPLSELPLLTLQEALRPTWDDEHGIEGLPDRVRLKTSLASARCLALAAFGAMLIVVPLVQMYIVPLGIVREYHRLGFDRDDDIYYGWWGNVFRCEHTTTRFTTTIAVERGAYTYYKGVPLTRSCKQPLSSEELDDPDRVNMYSMEATSPELVRLMYACLGHEASEGEEEKAGEEHSGSVDSSILDASRVGGGLPPGLLSAHWALDIEYMAEPLSLLERWHVNATHSRITVRSTVDPFQAMNASGPCHAIARTLRYATAPLVDAHQIRWNSPSSEKIVQATHLEISTKIEERTTATLNSWQQFERGFLEFTNSDAHNIQEDYTSGTLKEIVGFAFTVNDVAPPLSPDAAELALPADGYRFDIVARHTAHEDCVRQYLHRGASAFRPGALTLDFAEMERKFLVGFERDESGGGGAGEEYWLFRRVGLNFNAPRKIHPLNATHEEYLYATEEENRRCLPGWQWTFFLFLEKFFRLNANGELFALLSFAAWAGANASIVTLKVASRLLNLYTREFGYRTRVLSPNEKRVLLSMTWLSKRGVLLGLLVGVFKCTLFHTVDWSEMSTSRGLMWLMVDGYVLAHCVLVVNNVFVLATYRVLPRPSLGLGALPVEALMIPNYGKRLWELL